MNTKNCESVAKRTFTVAYGNYWQATHEVVARDTSAAQSASEEAATLEVEQTFFLTFSMIATSKLPKRGRDQCWAGIDKKHTRGYGYPSNQERPHGYGDGYDMCSRILPRVEFNTRAMPDETHGGIHVCQNRYPWEFGIAKSHMCFPHGSRV